MIGFQCSYSTAESGPAILPGASSLVVDPKEGSSVDEIPLVDLSDPGVPVSESSEDNEVVVKSAEDKVNKLANLAQQIESFDPVSVFNSTKDSSAHEQADKTEESALFSKDINDETLIDDLIQDTVTDSDSVEKGEEIPTDENNKSSHEPNGLSESSVKDQNCVDADSPHCESDKVIVLDKGANENVRGLDNTQIDGNSVSEKKSKREIANRKDVVNEQPKNEISVSTAEVIGNDLEGAANGAMSGSTESEGFNEEQNQEEPAEAYDTAIVTEQVKAKEQNAPIEKKTDAVKSESPTKAAKSKRKEDKSIGK